MSTNPQTIVRVCVCVYRGDCLSRQEECGAIGPALASQPSPPCPQQNISMQLKALVNKISPRRGKLLYGHRDNSVLEWRNLRLDVCHR